MRNVFEEVPYKDSGMGNRKLVDEKHFLVMQIALHSGQTVPLHQANSNVHLLVLEGEVIASLGGHEVRAGRGALVPVAFRTQMEIRNAGTADATFLVLKTPNPSEMKG